MTIGMFDLAILVCFVWCEILFSELDRVTASRLFLSVVNSGEGGFEQALLPSSLTPCYLPTKLQLFSETTKHFANYFRFIFNKNLTTGSVPIVRKIVGNAIVQYYISFRYLPLSGPLVIF